MLDGANPTAQISIDFAAYRLNRLRDREAHLVDGVPDYGFALDRRLRRGLAAVPPVRAFSRLLVRWREPFFQQTHMMNAVLVSPEQFPDLFRIGESCARRLGIGVPRIFVQFDHAPNAWTYASDDMQPSIIVTTALVQAMEQEELTGIIGHECGHIHNLHSVYNTLVALMTNVGARAVLNGAAVGGLSLPLLNSVAWFGQQGLRLLMLRWSRCAEITADRAGAICAGSVEPMIRGLAKLTTGGEEKLAGLNIEAYLHQLDTVRTAPARVMEYFQTHPLIQKRIEALRLFDGSEILLAWRPECRGDGPVRSHAEVEAGCERLVQVLETRRVSS